ncbi:adenylyl-sulfate kinase [Candidatus Pelagibacter sp.]|jgi:adenylylsulfate kinase-like enzyme|nr:adenylyl-sulfate kinase [Candidatus Pelagibacter sp.]
MLKIEPKIIWFTGLSGAGKTTLSNKLYEHLKNKNFKIKRIDGDIFRKKIKNRNNFTKKNILENNLSIIKYIIRVKKNYNFILVSTISPLIKSREKAKKIFNVHYHEVYIKCRLKTLENRDTKGLYKKAKQKILKNLIGYNSKIKYEKSKYLVTKIDTDKKNIKESMIILKKLISKILKNNLISKIKK